MYSHLFNKRGGWNKRGGGAKNAKSLNVEVGIKVEGGILWKKLMHDSNKRGVEGGKKSKESINVEGGYFCGVWNFSKSVSVGSAFIRETRVGRIK
jgi:hypothetical protein